MSIKTLVDQVLIPSYTRGSERKKERGFRRVYEKVCIYKYRWMYIYWSEIKFIRLTRSPIDSGGGGGGELQEAFFFLSNTERGRGREREREREKGYVWLERN